MGENFSSKGRALDTWYSVPGPENDIILSTRIRLARNLADFVFPRYLNSDDAERVQSLIFDSFTHLEKVESYQALRSASLDSLGQKILSERGMFPYSMYARPWTGGVIKGDGKLSCYVNYEDHLRISSFSSGFDCDSAFIEAKMLDTELQNYLQFAASSEFGYLTSLMRNLGSGMKLSCVVHLPSMVTAGVCEKFFRAAMSDGCAITAFWGANDTSNPLGAFFIVQNRQSYQGSEEEQVARFEVAVLRLVENERGIAMNLLDGRTTYVKDLIYRAIATIKYGRLVTNREGIDLVSKIKWGLNLGLVSGIKHHELTALLYRIQNAHLTYVIRNGAFNFEQDITTEDEKIERLRALVLQEALTNAQLEF
ncbi:MAG: hypothetical protein GX297_09580 [Treponema sp.]|jgi:protein arginine kinase|nr:hypothetical protein [Treponema sp.]